MAERMTAGEQLSRILQLLPLAAREDGVTPQALAAALGTSPQQVVGDLAAVYTRAYYHPAGSSEDVQILIEADRVHVWTQADFRRPPRLSPEEALSLGLGLRILAAEAETERRSAILSLAERLEASLAGMSPEEQVRLFAVESRQPDEATLRDEILRAARERRRCLIEYLKPGAEDPDSRPCEPYVVVAASGRWYLLARCGRSHRVQAFRLDRILGVTLEEETFVVPPDFDPANYFSDGRVFRPAGEVHVAVRYSPQIARWIVERGPVTTQDDGSVVVRHRVADPRWLVRHVLQYGADAEVVEPHEYRDLVLQAVQRMRV